MKTPMQELIDSVEYMAQELLNADELYDYFMEKATQMLEKEKEERRKIFSIAYRMIPTEFNKEHCDEQFELFNKAFNTKER
jgi:hypothetical protein